MIKLWICCCCCLPLRHLSLTSNFGYRIHPVTGLYRFHSGIDLRARRDTVYAVTPGRILHVGYDEVTGVYIQMASGDFTFLYGHLSQVFVLAGDSVAACSPLGVSGATGRVTGEHLHFGVKYKKQPVNPLMFLNAVLREVP